MNNSSFKFQHRLVFFLASILPLGTFQVQTATAQAVPYARTFPNSPEEVDRVLKDMHAYAGQKLPIVDGFVAVGDQPLDRYERAFYQFSIELAPGMSGGTVVSVTAKITAWYADRDPSKSGYQVLPSNGRLELDLLDRINEKLGGKPPIYVPRSTLQAPRPKLDLSDTPNGALSSRSTVSSPRAPSEPEGDELAALRMKRDAQEKRQKQLNAELQSLQEIQQKQAHPHNLVVVKKSGTPVLARPADGSRILFNATANDEFEFLDAQNDWIHVQISGASRGYIRRSSLELPELIAAKLEGPHISHGPQGHAGFRITHEDTNTFPGNWDPLRGKAVRIYTVQPVSQDPAETGPPAKLRMASSLFEKFSSESISAPSQAEGVAIVFDSADGGIIACTASSLRQIANGSVPDDALWKECYLDPPDAFFPLSRR